MKTKIITWLCCCFVMLGFGQSIDKIEYFFNSDPGLDNGIDITPNANSGNLTQTESISIGSLTGFNSLYIRTMDNTGTWTMYETRVFYVTDFMPTVGASNITAAEYFFNTDPGFGMGDPITLGSFPLTFSIETSLEGLPVGFNSIYVRVKDNLGLWSIYEKRIFYITDFMPMVGASNIDAAEYFFNSDPGLGNGKPITLGSFPLMFDIDTTSNNLSVGFNSLYIRTQDDLGVWSIYEKRIFYVEDTANLNIPTITGAEYFYDTDPGFGNAYATSITTTGNSNEFTIDLGTSLETCDLHDFYIRLQNSDGTWGLYDYSEDLDIFDNAPPTIVVFPNITAELDISGQASIILADVDNGTFDDCELVSVVLNQAQFDYTCSDLGINSVTITATDAEAKVSNQNVDVTVVDFIDPVAVAQDITVQLDSNGEATIIGAQIDNGSTDNCSVTNFSLDVSSFDCSHLGSNTVTLTAIDQSGNNSTNAPTATVTVEDNMAPNVITQNITVQLDGSGNTSITPAQIDNNSTDNCTITNRSLDITSFTCANIGANVVTLTVTDQSGNSANNTATVTVEDSVDPNIATQNITVQLDGSGNASITASQIDNNSTDNCNITNRSLDVTSFTCNDLGANLVTLTVTDQSGNSSNDTATVTVEDNINPIVITQNITAQLDDSGNASITASQIDNNSTDNCNITSRSLDVTSFTCNDLGGNVVTLTVTDQSGNSSNDTATVAVEDNINPTANGQNITRDLAGNPSVTITASDVDNGSSDNCNSYSLSVDVDTFNAVGVYLVVLTITDGSGNTDTANVTVTIEDSLDVEEYEVKAKNIILIQFQQMKPYLSQHV
ncbi:hypothetical protein [Seonamhaeicola maritimus]|uniref:HYR domain-containing protein n=1 Tax=Seonamhaeicola maritimus TaxID=2591822 RepID=A0A5C7GKH5_9FLAO|nr:hypothetical protein [Seonamhaeicola maritimus]TXG38969.1 hypothetical protein FUA22_03530 [Seonamhaeicola maritimus]